MNIVFKSKREKVVFSVFASLLTWGVLSMIVIMLWSLKADGMVLMDFNTVGELWIELPFAFILAGFGFWLMWFAAKKGRVGTMTMTRIEKRPLIPGGKPMSWLVFDLSTMPCEICGEMGEHEHYGVRTCLTKKRK